MKGEQEREESGKEKNKIVMREKVDMACAWLLGSNYFIYTKRYG